MTYSIYAPASGGYYVKRGSKFWKSTRTETREEIRPTIALWNAKHYADLAAKQLDIALASPDIDIHDAMSAAHDGYRMTDKIVDWLRENDPDHDENDEKGWLA